jgi:hypothetical protein
MENYITKTSNLCSSGDQIGNVEMCWTHCTLENGEQHTQDVSLNPLTEETTHKVKVIIEVLRWNLQKPSMKMGTKFT